MQIAALYGAGSLYDPTAAARNLSTGVYRSRTAPENQPVTTTLPLQTAAEIPDTGSMTPASDVLRAQGYGVSAAWTQDMTGAAPSTLNAVGPTSYVPNAGATPSSATTATASSSLLTDLESYTKAANQGESQAYQEYAKAWGGRVVHGEVELPPLSVYSD